ncbi:MAG: hypothetical protein FJ014_04510 [Chloroflexi bacterium]|nr:hypothetical protein [Chloroflexota bacterium]
MSVTELVPLLQELDRTDKLRVLLLLVYELAQEEGALLQPGMAYPVWSPYDAFEAASALLNVLKEAESTPHA